MGEVLLPLLRRWESRVIKQSNIDCDTGGTKRGSGGGSNDKPFAGWYNTARVRLPLLQSGL